MDDKKREKIVADLLVDIKRGAVMLTIAISIIFAIGAIKAPNAKKITISEKVQTGYMSYLVKEGDTIWGISKQISKDSGEDIDVVMDEIRTLNNLKGSTIHTKCYILVPVYE